MPNVYIVQNPHICMASDDDMRTPRDIEYELCSSFQLEPHDRQSIREIEHMFALEKYDNHLVLHDHIYYLEHLMHRLEEIRLAEMREGFPTFDLDRSLIEINDLFKKLKRKLIELDPDAV